MELPLMHGGSAVDEASARMLDFAMRHIEACSAMPPTVPPRTRLAGLIDSIISHAGAAHAELAESKQRKDVLFSALNSIQEKLDAAFVLLKTISHD